MNGYSSFKTLARHETKGKDYEIYWRKGASDIAVIAPHGGGIEPGTMEISDAVAGGEHGFYCFRGIKTKGNAALHIPSKTFDEPIGLNLVKSSETVISVHGCEGKQAVVHLGGLNRPLIRNIDQSLSRAGFTTGKHPVPGLQGRHPDNICNRSRRNQGVQLEISEALRKRMFDHPAHVNGRKRTDLFYRFVRAVRTAISADNAPAQQETL